VLDSASNTMYIPESCTGLEPTVLLSATSTHDGHVFYQRKGLVIVWVAGDLRVILIISVVTIMSPVPRCTVN